MFNLWQLASIIVWNDQKTIQGIRFKNMLNNKQIVSNADNFFHDLISEITLFKVK